MTVHFTITIYTAPPANPKIEINGDALVTGDEIVQVHLTTLDFNGGAADVEGMKIWGDVDPTGDPNVQVSEGLSNYINYAEFYNVRLSAGEALKTLYARLNDNVGNQTVVISAQIRLDLTRPVVTLVEGVVPSRVSKTVPFDTIRFQ